MHLLPSEVVVEQVAVEEEEVLQDGLFGTGVLALYSFAVETKNAEVEDFEVSVFQHADLPYTPFLSQQSLQDPLELLALRVSLGQQHSKQYLQCHHPISLTAVRQAVTQQSEQLPISHQ